MTYKEVISHLRNEIVNATGTLAALPPKAAEISGLNHHINALDLAIKAVKKQIPEKPHPTKVVVDYCYKCGQKIDWSEE